MATKVAKVKRKRAILASKEFRRKCLAPSTDLANRSRQVQHEWPAEFRIGSVERTTSLESELAAWEQASDDDYESFEND